MKNSFYQNGLAFECTQCHACCRHDPGYVFLSFADLDRLCERFSLDRKTFVETYCRWVDVGDGPVLSLKEKKNFDCEFWDGGCTVYTSRPTQCRTYPFWPAPLKSEEAWRWESRFCPGIGQGKLKTASEIEAALLARAENPVVREEDF